MAILKKLYFFLTPIPLLMIGLAMLLESGPIDTKLDTVPGETAFTMGVLSIIIVAFSIGLSLVLGIIGSFLSFQVIKQKEKVSKSFSFIITTLVALSPFIYVVIQSFFLGNAGLRLIFDVVWNILGTSVLAILGAALIIFIVLLFKPKKS